MDPFDVFGVAGGVDLPKEEKPILVLPVVGLGGSSFHPQDALLGRVRANGCAHSK